MAGAAASEIHPQPWRRRRPTSGCSRPMKRSNDSSGFGAVWLAEQREAEKEAMR